MASISGSSLFVAIAAAELAAVLLITALLFRALAPDGRRLAFLFLAVQVFWKIQTWILAAGRWDLDPDWALLGAHLAALALLAAGVPPALWLIRARRPWLAILALSLASGIGAWAAWAWHSWSGVRAAAPPGWRPGTARVRPVAARPALSRRVARDTILSPEPLSLLPTATASGLTVKTVLPFALIAMVGLMDMLLWPAIWPLWSEGGPNPLTALRPFGLVAAGLAAVASVVAVDAFRAPPGAALCVAMAVYAGALMTITTLGGAGPALIALMMLAWLASYAVDPLAQAWLGREGRATAFTMGLLFAASSWGGTASLSIVGYDDSASLVTVAALILMAALAALPLAGRARTDGPWSSRRPLADLAGLLRDPLLIRVTTLLLALQLGLVLRRQAFSELGSKDAFIGSLFAYSSTLLPFGAVVGGWLADRTRTERSYIAWIAGASAICALLTSLSFLTDDPDILPVGIVGASLAAGVWYGPLMALFQRRANETNRVLYAAVPLFAIALVNQGVLLVPDDYALAPRDALIVAVAALIAAALMALGARTASHAQS
jgi:hypothetical protein